MLPLSRSALRASAQPTPRAATSARRTPGSSALRAVLTFAILIASITIPAQSAQAVANRTFSNSYAATIHGDIAEIGNANSTCNPSWTPSPACDTNSTTLNNSSKGYGVLVDTDGDGSTTNSSSSTVAIPTGATIAYARLTWGATGDDTDNNGEAAVRFDTPQEAGINYRSVAADYATRCGGFNAATANRGFACSADVTSLVQAAGSGQYTVGNIEQRPVGNGSADTIDHWSGWALYIVYERPTDQLRRIVLSDGFLRVANGVATSPISITGFIAPANNQVRARLVYAAGEGDAGITGDNATLNSTTLDPAATPDLMNSSNSGHTYQTSRSPAFANQYGFDVDSQVVNGAIPNGATSATFTFTTNGDTYYPFSLGVAIDLEEPKVVLTKSLVDLNGGVVESGDILEYTVVAKNEGDDGATDVAMTDNIPQYTTYVPGSMAVTAGANAGTKTDAAGDDQATYDSGTNRVTMYLGTGANATTGGSLGISAETTVKFRVLVDNNIADGTPVTNTANGAYKGQTALFSYANPSTIASTPIRRADLTVTQEPGTLVAGQSSEITLTANNIGGASTRGNQVTLTTSVPSGVAFGAITSAVGWTCSTASLPTITCTRSDSLGANASYPDVTYSVTPNQTGSSATFTATVSGGNQLNTNNDSDTDSPAITRQSDLRITNIPDATSPNVGDTVTYSIAGRNLGPSTTTGVTVTGTLPAGLQLSTATLGGSGCSITGQSFTCSVGALGVGGSSADTPAIVVRAVVQASAAGAARTFTPSISGSDPDPVSANNSAGATVTVNPAADIALTETRSPATVNPGSDITFTFTATNNGPSTAAGVVLTDNLPSGITVQSVTPSQGTCGAATPGSAFTCNLGSIANAANATVTVVVRPTIGSANTTITNPGSVTATTFDQVSGNNSATASATVNPAADLRTTVISAPGTANVGDDVDYLVTVHNDGAQNATGATVALDLPDNATVVLVTPSAGVTCPSTGDPRTCTIGGIVNGGSATVTVRMRPTTANAGSPATLVATAAATTYDPTSSNNTASATTNVNAAGDLQLTEVSSPATLNPGSDATFTFSIKNNGPNTATGVVLTDTLPTGITVQSVTTSKGSCGTATPGSAFTCAIGTIANGATETVTVVVRPTLASAGTTVSNPGSVASTTFDGVSANNTATASVTVNPAADLRTTVSPSPASAGLGTTVDYTVTVRNDGPSTAAGVTTALDLPNGATIVSVTPSQGTCPSTGDPRTCNLGSISNGAAPTIVVRATMTAANVGADATVDATATTTTYDPNTANNSASGTVSVGTSANLALTETVSTASANPGTDVTYTFTVRNNGPSPANSVVLTDNLPSGITVQSVTPSQGTCGTATPGSPFTCAIGTLANGATATVAVVVRGTVASAGTTKANPGSVTAGTSDPDSSDNSATASFTVNPASDLRTTVAVSPTSATVGDPVDYTFTVNNDGPSNATGATLALNLPTNVTVTSVTPSQGTCPTTGNPRTCTIGAITSGNAATVVVRVVPTGAAAGTTRSVVGTAAATQYDPTSSNNAATGSVTVDQGADLQLTETVSPSPANIGSDVTYTFTVKNNGPGPASGVVFTDDLPAGAVVQSITTSKGTCGTGDPFTCNLGGLTNGQTETITVVVRPATSAAGTTLTNPGVLTSSSYDPSTADNSASATLTVNPAADLRTAVVVDQPTSDVGETRTYTVTVTNDGPSGATGVQSALDLPNGSTIVSVTPSQGTCPTTGDPRTCALGGLPSGSSATIEVKVTLTAANASGAVTLAANSSATQYDQTPGNNAASASTTAGDAADLQITQTVAPSPANPGSDVTYTLTVRNNGPDAATGVIVTDDLPSGATIVSITPSQGTCGTGDPFTCPLGSIADGATATVTVVVRPQVSSAGSGLANAASVTSSTVDPSSSNNASSATANVNPAADLRVSASVDSPTATVGSTRNYLLTVTNDGPSAASGAALLVDLPAGATILAVTPSQGTCPSSGDPRSCTLGTINSGSSATVAVQVRIESANASSPVAVAGTASATTYDQTAGNNAASASSSAGAAADLRITKTADKTTANVGDTITWTITARNFGPDTALGTTVTDAIPAGVTITSATSTVGTCTTGSSVSCSVGSLANAAQAVITVVGRVERAAAGSPVGGQASVTGSVFDPDTSNNVSASTSTNVGPAADLRVVNLVDNPNPKAGDTVTWTIQVFNDGPSGASGVQLTDVVPAGAVITGVTTTGGTCSQSGQNVACAVGNVPAGASQTVRITAQIPTNSSGGPINNTATATSATNDPDPSNNTSTAGGNAAGAADLSITLTPDRDTATVGERITWTGVIGNGGPQTARGVVVTLELPEGMTDVTATTPGGTCTVSGRTVTCQVTDVAAGSSGGVTISGIVTRAAAEKSLVLTGTVAGDQTDPAPADNTGSGRGVAIAPAVDLRLEKSASKAEVAVGDQLTVTSSILNRGPSAATDVIVVDDLPEGVELVSVTPSQGSCTVVGQRLTCNLGRLADGETAKIDTVVVVRSAGAGQKLLSGGTVTSAQFDTNNVDNSASIDAVGVKVGGTIDTPAPAPFIDLTKTVDNTSPAAGDSVVYTITAANKGNAAATGVRVVDALPAGLTYKSTKVTGGTCARSARTITCVANTLDAGKSLVVKITAVVEEPGKVIANTASVIANGLPATPAKGQLAAVSLRATGGPFVFAAIKPATTARAGKTVRIAVKVTNTGAGTARDAQACFTLPSSVVLVKKPAGLTQKGTKFCLSAAALAAGKNKRVVILARVVGPVGSRLRPTLTATASNAKAKTQAYAIQVRGTTVATRGSGVTG